MQFGDWTRQSEDRFDLRLLLLLIMLVINPSALQGVIELYAVCRVDLPGQLFTVRLASILIVVKSQTLLQLHRRPS